MKQSTAWQIVGGLSKPSKMPGAGYGLPAAECMVGSKLRAVVGSTCSHCYAMKGRYVFPAVQQAQYRRLEALNHPQWILAMVQLLQKQKWFRWHDSGDIQSLQHLRNIVKVAEATPNTHHWLPTREYGLIQQYKTAYGAFPQNLIVRVSAPMTGKAPVKHWKHASMVVTALTDKPAAAVLCTAYQRGGKCGSCRACWSANVQLVAYKLH